MTRLIGIIVIFIAAIVGYMYFFGKEDDKVKAHTIVNETKELGKSVGDFISRQKDKYDNGEFDALLKKVGDGISKLRSKPENKSDEVKQDLRDLEIKLKAIDPQKLSEENREKLKKLIQDLEKELN
jgi:flagellar basal body-associated protein FliL